MEFQGTLKCQHYQEKKYQVGGFTVSDFRICYYTQQ
jgi:hypothetical protein